MKLSVASLLGSLLLVLCLSSCEAWEGKVVFSDDFEGDFLRKHYWDYEEGCGGKGERDTNLECYKKGTQNVEILNGSLVITARVEKSKEYTMGEYKKMKMHYTSGKIIQSGFGFSYGVYVVRARLPKGKHLLPSIYLLPMDQRHNTCKYEEIDILMGRGQRTSTVVQGAHFGRDYVNVASRTLEKVFRKTDFSADFHEFAVKWSPTRMEWFVDNKKMYEATTHYLTDWTTKSGENLPTCSASSSLFSQRSALVMSLAVGGRMFPEVKYGVLSEAEAMAWPKPTFEIDWVKVYDTTIPKTKEKLTVFNIPGIDGLGAVY